ncbi:metal-dependent hydrolase [Planktothrix agardhii 1031]|jgi:inner membrane protein|uniref:metal-dependent hydrolase n=1 Tax=Planktothrix agardhii TaxID=1160 RepID=UPI001D09DD5C|nr:metal-dependent hydrolase [Planktothrix agardhii]MCB8777871.1 metal-dependent hydrolase [Planktothrix agardhii 1031]
MDSLTHIALGACMGEAFAGKKLGKKAMIWGAVAQSIPDIDFIASFWMDVPSSLLAHRGFTHSILFALIMALLMALASEKWHRPHNISFYRWFFFFGAVILIHIFIDAFNNYGVAWFEPFSHKRLSFNAIYVADPLFSLWPALSLLALIILKVKHQSRKMWWQFGLFASAFYLLLSIYNKYVISEQVAYAFKKQNISHERYFTTPAPLQNWLWFVVAGNDSGYYTGFRSLLDEGDTISFQYFPQKAYLLDSIRDHAEVQKLIRFSGQFYTVEKWDDTLVFNDLRFGQIIGWKNPKEHFVFHYYLNHPHDNKLVVQRGRFDKWDKSVAISLWNRMWAR